MFPAPIQLRVLVQKMGRDNLDAPSKAVARRSYSGYNGYHRSAFRGSGRRQVQECNPNRKGQEGEHYIRTLTAAVTVLCPSGDYKEGEDREEEADNNQEVHTLPQDYSNGALL